MKTSKKKHPEHITIEEHKYAKNLYVSDEGRIFYNQVEIKEALKKNKKLKLMQYTATQYVKVSLSSSGGLVIDDFDDLAT